MSGRKVTVTTLENNLLLYLYLQNHINQQPTYI